MEWCNIGKYSNDMLYRIWDAELRTTVNVRDVKQFKFATGKQ